MRVEVSFSTRRQLSRCNITEEKRPFFSYRSQTRSSVTALNPSREWSKSTSQSLNDIVISGCLGS